LGVPKFRLGSGAVIDPSKFIAEKLPLKFGCPEAAIRRAAPQSSSNHMALVR
jgi:hypothetical protein